MRFVRSALSAALVSSLAASTAHAWPAAIQTGTTIRVTTPATVANATTGTFVRHDDSTLTFTPARSHQHLRVRFADIERLEADAAPLRAAGRGTAIGAVVGGVAGWGLTSWIIGATSEGHDNTAVVGLLGVIPGALMGAFAGGMIGGGAASVTPGESWIELPRSTWAARIPGPSTPPADSTSR